ncbi:MAG TPA: thermonuclease family protein [Saprospiraceae bacterium]|nr:thermonuclease family protein [Saprospiraceae bacterium]
MKSWLTILLLLACSNSPSPTLPDETFKSCPSVPGKLDPTGLRGQATGIVDGDTFDLLPFARAPVEVVRIRLEGIDAPEKGQPYGKAAKQYLSDLIFGKDVRAVGAKKDRNGRRICTVFMADTLDVNRAMVAAGYAWHFKKYSGDPALDSLERSACAARVGLWAATEPPIPPWDWRKGKRGNRN